MSLVDDDTIVLTTVGIDIGSSTSHAAIARLVLTRMSDGMASRFVVVDRTVLKQSDILLTPYRPDGLIDTGGIRAMLDETFRGAGLTPDDVDTGAVILTGTALERANSEAVARLFAEDAGRFVCAAAGHNLEAILAAHGSGAVDASRQTGQAILHVDIGGGTTKFGWIRAGHIVETAAIQVGGRLVSFAGDRIVRLEPAARVFLDLIGEPREVGDELPAAVRTALVERMADLLVSCLAGDRPADEPLRSLVLTGQFGWRGEPPALVTFSGGVSEFLRGSAGIPADDLGGDLMRAVADRASRLGTPVRLEPLREGVRATVVGASQYSVQVTGSTIDLVDAGVLPLRGVPVARPATGGNGLTSLDVADSLSRMDLVDGAAPVALSLPFSGVPNYPSLSKVARAVVDGIPASLLGDAPTVIAFRADVGLAFGTILRELCPDVRNVLILDGLDLSELDFLDLGAVLEPAGVVPVVVKSLAFPTD